jgi:hypothetical protein
MDVLEELRSKTEGLLSELVGVEDAQPDVDGDFMVEIKSHRVFIRPTREPIPHLFIWGGIARYADASCLTELNELNLSSGWCKFVRAPHDGAVYVVAHLPAYSLDKRALLESAGAVAAGVAVASPMIETVFGGRAA